MKKIYLCLLLLALGFLLSPVISARETYQTNTAQLTELSLAEVTSKIRAKESFYLYIGRADSVEAQEAVGQLVAVLDHASKPIYYLNTKGVDTKKYKAFSKKYKIRAVTYLAHFSNRKQVAVYRGGWSKGSDTLIGFFQEGQD